MYEWRVRPLDEIDSTNRYLLNLASSEAPGLVVTAQHQTSGRGRLERNWVDVAGSSLLFSVLLPKSDATVATRALALAVADACIQVGGFEPEIKWPNDLVVGNAKLAGILAETATDLEAVVVGCGLNFDTSPDLGHDDRRSVTNFLAHCPGHSSRAELLSAILGAFSGWLSTPSKVGASFASRCVTVGQTVTLSTAQGLITGHADAIDDDGRLVVDQRIFSVGDIVAQSSFR